MTDRTDRAGRTDRADGIAAPFVQRLRDDLLDNLPGHRRRRRRRRQVGLGAAAAAVVAVVALVAGPGGPGGGGRDDRGADVATESTAPGITGTTEVGPIFPPPDAALEVVHLFLEDLRRGDLEAAAGRWTGYPGSLGDVVTTRVAGVQEMLDQLPWLADPAYVERKLEAPLWPGDHQVVTLTAATGPDQPMEAAAFVVDRGTGGVGAVIERLPSPNPTGTPAAGTAVTRGQEIVVPMALVEAHTVVAWFGGQEVPVTTTNEVDEQSVTVHVPDTVIGETVLTILTSTPELPAARAFWFPVG
jgi:hypothetical protein